MAATLPIEHKILQGQEGKYLNKKAMEPHLSNDLLYRPNIGSSVPLARWSRRPPRQRTRNAIPSETLETLGWFDRSYRRHPVGAHLSGASDCTALIWRLMMFEAFVRHAQGIGGSGAPLPAPDLAISKGIPV